MGLNVNALQAAIKSALDLAVEEEWSIDRVALEWANAIDAFVRSGAVTSVTTNVNVPVYSITNPSQQIGTATGSSPQTGVGQIE